MGLNFSKKNHCPKTKAYAKTDSLKNAKNRQKMTKIGTLSLVSRLTRALVSKLLMSATRT